MTKQGRSRFVVPVFILVAGSVFAGLQWAAGDRENALFSVVLMTAVAGLLLAGGEREWAVLFRGEGDERHRTIQQQALLFSYYAVVAVALVGGLVTEVARGELGKFGVICFVGGSTQVISTLVLRARL